MRALIGIACGLLFVAGCTKKAELPAGTVQAPKEVMKIGVSPDGSGGLPQPPNTPEK